MNPDTEPDDVEAPQPTSVFSQWPVIVLASFALLVLTENPLLTGLLPYLKAGWPASNLALWLKRTDPWPARGTVGFLYCDPSRWEGEAEVHFTEFKAQ